MEKVSVPIGSTRAVDIGENPGGSRMKAKEFYREGEVIFKNLSPSPLRIYYYSIW
jgi:hypothetical protein